MTQLALPTDVSHTEVMRERALGGAIALSIRAAGLEPKRVQADLRWDKASYSRMVDGHEGISWPKLDALMGHVGNDAPVL
jgi:hypothetical protein